MILYYHRWSSGGALALVNVIIVWGFFSLGQRDAPRSGCTGLDSGDGVDANIPIFERLEELNLGKSIINAAAGAQKVTSTIVDANDDFDNGVDSDLAGHRSGEGFGYTLAIGICASIFCALVVTRF